MNAVADHSTRLSFHLPSTLEATAPPEARGVARDGVRLMIAQRTEAAPVITHSTFRDLPQFLDPGDLVVINTSGTIPAAIDAVGNDGTPLVVHLSTQLGDGRWVVEPRRPIDRTTARWTGALPPGPWSLGEDARMVLGAPYRRSQSRLWTATLTLPAPVLTWLAAHGRPIRYSYVPEPWPIEAYQNVYTDVPGSAEMPSAGRPFTHEVLTRLVAKGVGVTPIVLHTGVASLEADELPYPERVRVPEETADRVNLTHAEGHRVVAIGTTVVRALESATGDDGCTLPLDGWTDLVITPERGVRAVDGLLTGWHEPEASHLLMLEAVGGRPLLEASYDASLAERYLWHEFGDSHLILR
jgi:S-adenosylmethionine:tRNA ribosyltransferase-isomerase